MFQSSSNENNFQDHYTFKTDTQISDIELNVNEVRDCLQILDITKAFGLDGIPARVLKECSTKFHPAFVVYLICL